VVVLLLGMPAAPAAADTTLIPSDRQAWPAAQTQTFAAYVSDYDELPDAFTFTVATSPATDGHGLLATPIASFAAPAQPRRPGTYLAPATLGTPGTYYWQASYSDDDGDTYGSAVRTLTILAPPPPDPPTQPVLVPPPVAPLPVAAPRPPDTSTVRIAVRRAIHNATHMVPRGVVYRCVRTPAAATCRPSWHDVRARYRGTLQLSFRASPITAAFTGTRTARGHRRGRAVIWTTSL
jgi:hypothetical protein